ncbi:KUP system potassium uptake protein [Thermotomaculum hydrothermale]|uniref:Probable potassium transport system protein Kup n=1 Tax=Thermotomaculum hydrothermale TaxID=981385 RepID=A0A7R6SYI7_9BACT|nr:potassium transporter Kup [Thermotomaculum hydrothermale]BBB31772.1 KUP system potassium uptake protein [Thermotomaculum hydrothermale]
MEKKDNLFKLSIAALGIVFGDIGTSPLYAIKECFYGEYGIKVDSLNILGVLSLIFWALTLVVSIKYLAFVLNANNDGEGGIMALTSLVNPRDPKRTGRKRLILITIGIFAASLLYGDGMITPAISVMSALEGLEVVTDKFIPYVVPMTIAILVILFMFQSKGTAKVGGLFGPIVFIWFIVLAISGAYHIVDNLHVFKALNPYYGISFFIRNKLHGFMVLGSVFLVVTGAEAMYADMGHFGKTPIRLTWGTIVFPALVLNYFGQGALLLNHPEFIKNPFFSMMPSYLLIPSVILATMATIIASQAVITGSFSLTMQAVEMGYLPRLKIIHTSAAQEGQIYVPIVNWILMIATIGLVIGFGSSTKLAGAYGVAVTSTMLVTTILFAVVAIERFKWSKTKVFVVCGIFGIVDLMFFLTNLGKITHGAWFPLLVGGVFFTLLVTWKRGREILYERYKNSVIKLDDFRQSKPFKDAVRVRGNAFFLAGTADVVPRALLHNLEHNKVVHSQVIFLHFITEEIPRVPNSKKIEIQDLGSGFKYVVARFGFMEDKNFPNVVSLVKQQGIDIDEDDISVFLGRQKIIVSDKKGMARWRKRLYIRLSNMAVDGIEYFHIPVEKSIEIGVPLEL